MGDKDDMTNVANRAATTAAISSSLGSVLVYSGATRVLAIAKDERLLWQR